MTDAQLNELLRRVKAGDGDAQAQIDTWIEETLGAISATPPIDCEADVVGPEALVATIGCGT